MSALLLHSLIMVFSVFISSLARVLLKQAANEPHASLFSYYFNLRVFLAYLIFFAATLLCIYAYSVVPLSLGVILDSTGYIFVTIFGVIFFNEKIGINKLFAMSLIIIGITIYSLYG